MFLLQLLFPLFAFAETAIPIKINWTYNKVSFEMKTYTVKDNSLVWATSNVSKLEGSPVLSEIPDSKLFMAPNRRMTFALVAYNPSTKPIYFFAAPHSALPSEHSLGFKFKCLCINHAFKIEPKSYWYRVVEMRLSPSYKGSDLKITHEIVGIDAATAKTFAAPGQAKNPDDHGNH